jgi:hypothetical protein
MRGVLAQVCRFRLEGQRCVTGIRQPLNTAVNASHPDVFSWLRDPSFEPVIPPPASKGCAYLEDPNRVAADIREIPGTDLYGNSTTGVGYLESALYKKEHVPLNLSAVGSPYQIGLASWNAADDAARRVRQDTQLDILIYVVALGAASEPPDEVLLRRIANVGSDDNTAYAPDRPSGLCVRAVSAADMFLCIGRIGQDIVAKIQTQAVPKPSGIRRPR